MSNTAIDPPRFYEIRFKPSDSTDQAVAVYQDKESGKRSYELNEANAIADGLQLRGFRTRIDMEPIGVLR